ncbi:Protein of unknown function [Pyronema omphalodes CBS 100304]|uniref:Uncharacterized protein n=1 Tax=Pyronema omphalodes (strain CBS 100304) TaxID=1076935 RepID=U4LR40_PYROM|nr:Protein of unknown function [Pyronema omphalodes CBS 100304]
MSYQAYNTAETNKRVFYDPIRNQWKPIQYSESAAIPPEELVVSSNSRWDITKHITNIIEMKRPFKDGNLQQATIGPQKKTPGNTASYVENLIQTPTALMAGSKEAKN